MSSETVSIIIGYYGDRSIWDPLAFRAVDSANLQTVEAEVILQYADTLHEARNKGAVLASGSHLVFVDADDALDDRFVQSMLAAEGDLRQPSTIGVYPDGSEDEAPVLIPPRSLMSGNFLIVGTMVRRDLFMEVGGFLDEPILEDWSLWIRCRLKRATIGHVPDAIYRVGVNEVSRNGQDQALHAYWYNEIRRRHAEEAAALAAEGFVI